MQRRLTTTVIALGLTLLAHSAHADSILYNQPLSDFRGGFCSPCRFPADFQVFASFELLSDSTLRTGTFAVADTSVGADDLSLSIWDAPFGTRLYSTTVAGSAYARIPIIGDVAYHAVLPLPNWFLPGGSYWVNLSGVNGNEIGWGTDDRSGDDLQYRIADGPPVLFRDGLYVGFSLSGVESDLRPIPEPATLTLVGLGLVGLGARLRRQRRQA